MQAKRPTPVPQAKLDSEDQENQPERSVELQQRRAYEHQRAYAKPYYGGQLAPSLFSSLDRGDVLRQPTMSPERPEGGLGMYGGLSHPTKYYLE